MTKEAKEQIATPPKKCGIIMPISSIDDCSSEHWVRVENIIKSSIEKAGYKGDMVSNHDENRVIHKSIMERLYTDEIAVCDVSCKNANVMFELGIRLTFDKPTVLIKDDKTDYSFDIAGIHHVEYPRDLRYDKIENFKNELANKIKATADGKGDGSFLKSFGTIYKATKMDTETVNEKDYQTNRIMEKLEELSMQNRELRNRFMRNEMRVRDEYEKKDMGSGKSENPFLKAIIQQQQDEKTLRMLREFPNIKPDDKNP